ncbi:SpoIIE-like protein phosphatase domain protein [Leptospira inadai serovar Lyme str. 10]|uniref:SpoIIE-like protein phosphatase domain protein n=2 Tax=Leptospira inadai serovar Lyme TaxID=293084 RepID=V6HDX7_9LEPT|nr:SpoIIE family protein phosphatase [Leptospira inadai]EQA37383.1 SpoIIE-like protein phosphatase domain protein [Leptospira inadai serovar Lyme str. 10]PNV75072.1 stage II sporulation protein E [Leptospira inadai serovar Lyme]
MKSLIRFACVCLCIPIFSLLAGEISVAEISDLSKVPSLDGQGWKSIHRQIDPKVVYESFLDGTETFSEWEDYGVPGNYFIKKIESNSSVKTIWIARVIRVNDRNFREQASIRLGVISDRDEVYWNGSLIGKTGIFGAEKPQAYDKVRIYKIPDDLLNKGNSNLLLIRVEKYFPNDIGITNDRTEIGSSQEVISRFYREEYLKLLFLTVYLTVGIYFAFLFIRRRKESENLYFSAFTLLLVAYQFFRNQIKYDLGISFFTMKKMEYLVLIFTVPFFSHFLRAYFRIPRSRFFLALDVLCLGVAFYILATGEVLNYMFVNQNIVQPIWLGYVAVAFYWLIREIRKKSRDALLIAAGMGLVLVATVVDILTDRGVFIFPRLVGYSFVFFILSLAIILANKFVRLNEEVEELNGSLEKKIEERTLELNNTLEQVQRLKVQQDGDYFLTTLLINPLTVNENKSPNVSVDFYIKQKKNFEFKTRSYEIGGDICVAGNLELKGRNYTVFLNGDAMGKSIQGAGGALVLGVVFRAILTRSKMTKEREISPEQWLKQVFMELQQVYESFNGSMYISAVIGILDEKSGFLYYINAEHPWTILYRDGKASFIEEALTCRKFGIPDNEQNLIVQTFQLAPEDVLFIGSDGKDDLKMVNASGESVINEDTEQILGVVEEGQGDPTRIFEILQTKGELYDDFTLLRAEYLGESEEDRSESGREYFEFYDKGKSLLKTGEKRDGLYFLEKAQEANPRDKNLLRLLGEQHFKEKNFPRAARYLENFIAESPASLDHFFYAAHAHKMAGETGKAIDVAERLLLRKPNHIKALIILADIYLSIGVSTRGRELLEKALRLDPENKKVIGLLNLSVDGREAVSFKS